MKQRRESERVIPINDVIVARGVYLRLEVQDWAFNRLEAFERERCLIAVTNSTKLICFRQKYRNSRISSLARLKIHIALSLKPPRSIFLCQYPLELHIEHDAMHKTLLIKQTTEQLE